jgi:signal transduction histidine kinase
MSDSRHLNQFGFALAHFVIGLLCLSLAIPPGYSSPIWPAAAVAAIAFFRLGRHAILPIFASAFLLNFVSKGLADANAASLASYAVIAGGTVLQGFIGGAIIRRLDTRDPQLADPLLVLRYSSSLIFLSSAVNASLSVPFLLLIGHVTSSGFLANWLTWWLGDAMGMAIFFFPLFLLFRERTNHETSRGYAVLLFALFVLTLSIPLYLFFVRHHENRHVAQVREDAGNLMARIEVIRRQNDTMVSSLGALKNTIQGLTYREFVDFAHPLLDEFPSTQALEWAPRVDFHQAGSEGVGGGRLLARPEASRQEAFPVTYVYPLPGNEKAMGFDLASEYKRADAIYESLSLGGLASTRPIVLVQETEGQSYSYLTLLPVDSESGGYQGVVLGVFRFTSIVEAALEDCDTSLFNFSLFDPREPETMVYSTYDHATAPSGKVRASNAARHASFVMSLGQGSPWSAHIYPSSTIYEFSNWWEIWVILVIASVLVFVSTASFALFSAQPEVIRNVVREKTHELETAKDTLHTLNLELDSRVTARTAELEKVNRELNFFVSAVSHDLQAPLAKLKMFVGLLKSDLDTTDTRKNTQASLQAIDHGATAMSDLIRGLLGMVNAERQSLRIVQVPLSAVVQDLLILMESDIDQNRTSVECGPLPTIWGDRALLTQLYQNIIGNAVKFSARSETPRITISFTHSKFTDAIVFTVEDNGPGIPVENRSDVFRAFYREHSQGDYPGSGIGLALCETIVTRLDGTIWVEDSELGGAKICFTVGCASASDSRRA